MAECAKSTDIGASVEAALEKKKLLSKYCRAKKSLKRRNKRKRSKAKYYKTLTKRRADRRTADICAEVESCGVTDMEWTPSRETEPYESSTENVPPEVAEWHKQEQIAYWKSRAISLELENRMLHKHLRDVYAKQVEDYQNYMATPNAQAAQAGEANAEEETEYYDKEEEAYDEEYWEEDPEPDPKPSTSKKKSKKGKQIKKEGKEPEEPGVVPKIPANKNRLEKMRVLYGDKAERIMGMETAVQLNFERQTEHLKPICWPNLPLKL